MRESAFRMFENRLQAGEQIPLFYVKSEMMLSEGAFLIACKMSDSILLEVETISRETTNFTIVEHKNGEFSQMAFGGFLRKVIQNERST